MTKRRIGITAVCVALAAAVFWERHAERNDTRAFVTRDGHRYHVQLKGRRFPLVHDPISLLIQRTSEQTFTLELPRIEGIVDGTEIAEHHYVGRVVISKGTMEVDLYFDDEGTRRPLSWNDEYTLIQTEPAESR